MNKKGSRQEKSGLYALLHSQFWLYGNIYVSSLRVYIKNTQPISMFIGVAHLKTSGVTTLSPAVLGYIQGTKISIIK
ncbi:hypothetical protein H5410_046120, partial [Solanum commersonii]